MEEMEVSLWSGRNAFVTGATGLLGSALVEELLNRKANVTCLIRDWVSGSRLAGSGSMGACNVVRGELEDYQLLLRTLNEYEVDSVFHLGAQTIVNTAARSPLSTFESNIKGTWTLLEACRQCSRLVQRVLVASSDKAYGAHDTLPYTEDTPLRGQYPYDVSKSCADLIAGSYCQTYGTPIAITRCGNLFGGGDLNFNRIVPGTIRSILQNENPIVRSDGTYVRDYFYVDDAVSAYLDLAERLPDDMFIGHGFNFGNETPISVLDLVRTITRLAGRSDLSPRVMNEASNEIREQYLNCSKARRMLGWQPKHTLEAGLLETIQWYSDWMQQQAGRA